MNEPVVNANEPPGDDTPRRRRRYLLILPVVLLLGAAALVAAAPALLSTAWGRDTALGWVNNTIPGRITIDEVTLSWLGGQSVENLVINDPQGRPVLTLTSFTTELSLLGALRQRLSLGQTVVHGLDVDLQFDADGGSNLAAALGGGGGAKGGGGSGFAAPATANMALIDSRIAITAPGIDPVVLDNLSGALEMTGKEAPIKLSFGGRSRQGDLVGSVTLNGRVDNLFPNGTLTPAAARANLHGSIEDLPVDALDQLLDLGGVLSAALGDRTSLDIDASGDTTRQAVSVHARAPRGELQLQGVVAEGRFDLSQPATARLALSPALIDAVNRLTSADQPVRLSDSVPLHLAIEQLSFPVDGFSLAEVALRAGLDARGSIRFTGVRDVGEAAMDDLHLVIDSPGLGQQVRLTLDGKPVTQGRAGSLTLNAEARRLLDDQGGFQPGAAVFNASSRISDLPTTLLDTLLQQDGLLLEAAGPTFGLDLNADTDDAGHTNIAVKLESARLNAGPIRLTLDDQLKLSEPTEIRFDLTPGLWRRLAGDETPAQLEGTSTWTLTLTRARMPFPSAEAPAFEPGRIVINGTLAAPAVTLLTAPDAPPLAVRNLKLSLDGDTLDTVHASVSAVVSQSGGWLASLDASPLQLTLDARTGIKPDASVKAVTGTLNLDSNGLAGVVKASVEEGLKRLSLIEPAVINATLTPALLVATTGDQASRATLREASGFRITLERLEAPLTPFDAAGLVAQGRLDLDTLTVESGGGVASTIEDAGVKLQFQGTDTGRLDLDLSGQVRSGGDPPGDLSLTVSAGNLLNADGAFDSENLSLATKGRLQHLPSALLDQLLNMDGMITATLGATADLAVETQLDKLRGPLSLSLNASNTRADIKARLTDEGLTLTEPLVAQFEPTPEFGQKVLAKIHPLFETTQRAEQPIRFEVPAEGVLIPVEDYAFSKIAVPVMNLDFGKIVLKSGWLLRGIVGLGQQFGKLENVQREEWLAWFTPGVLKIENGQVLYTRRLDILLDRRLHLATWGSADIAGDRSNLTLAFMPDTMERVFSITVAENDALHVPIKGPLSGPKVDFEKTAADLARLRAQEEVAGENPLAGLLLSSVGGKVTGAGPVPPASVSPLPWTEMLQEQDAARQSKPAATPETGQTKETQSAPESNPAKQPSTEEQVIKGLIDIFGKKKKE